MIHPFFHFTKIRPIRVRRPFKAQSAIFQGTHIFCLLEHFQLLDRTGNTFSWKIKNESISCPKQLCQYRRLFQVPKIEFYNSTQFSIVNRDVTNSKNQESSFRGNKTPNKLKPALFMLRTQTQSSSKSVKLI